MRRVKLIHEEVDKMKNMKKKCEK